ncbi:RHS repeat-associated core domain-containing protein [Trabulsiella odontotermitis]|uniref:RHS repeat-associated core domain-containing protein n=1 Tax=Trabulsiella odontotermitis TaxID=379893 RepID=UPI0024B684E8|nr:RHS repeat-associated core domain-containing protein [Trabulsiella odontotermitis]WHP32004.1 RHS repeat-associated core domain-containing protein [Trabulsiella odontotermitis]
MAEKQVDTGGYRPQQWRYRWEYKYDPSGRRISKRCTSHDKPGMDFHWNGDQLTEEIPVNQDGTPDYENAIRWIYEPGSFTPVARYEKGQLHYAVTDTVGRIQELLTEDGTIVWRGEQQLWGREESINKEDAPSCRLRFPGQYEDEESGLYYNRFRYYDCETGEYLCADPVGLRGGLNLYAYVPNPLSWIDPLGLCKVNSGADVTPDIIRNSLKGDTMQTLQGSVSLPAIQRYVDRLLKGDVAPPIKVDGNVVVEGNHRYVSGKVAGKMPDTAPGSLSPSQVPNIKPMSETDVDEFDWGNY